MHFSTVYCFLSCWFFTFLGGGEDGQGGQGKGLLLSLTAYSRAEANTDSSLLEYPRVCRLLWDPCRSLASVGECLPGKQSDWVLSLKKQKEAERQLFATNPKI